MDSIENAAFVSIGRAVGFAGFGIFVLMFGLSFDPSFAAGTGGTLCLGVTMILLYYAWRARTRSYRRTELWLILRKEDRPPKGIAQRVIGETLRETYFWFAQQAVTIAIVLLAAAIVLGVVHPSPPWPSMRVDPGKARAAVVDPMPASSNSKSLARFGTAFEFPGKGLPVP
ncbi:MAG: hypothetical protein ACR2O4_16000 [Hyphomicrobiaceae bacterium]